LGGLRACRFARFSNFPTQPKMVSCLGVGQSEDFAMTKTAAFKFVIWTTVAVALGIITWSSTAKHSPSIDQLRAKQAVVTSPEIAELPNLYLSRVRLLVSNLN
jgi:hypothetical protein